MKTCRFVFVLKLRTGLFFKCLFFWSLSFSGTVQAAQKYPFVVELFGKVQWTNKHNEEGRLKPKQVLIEKAGLQTSEKGQVLIQIDAHRQLRVLPNSRVMLPSISWESGETPVLVLQSGSLRWKEEAGAVAGAGTGTGTGKKYSLTLRSELFEFLSPEGDFIFSFDPQKAMAEVKVLHGRMEFSAMNAEDVALVTAGQQVSFQGVREGEEIVYDILLKGKKVPRGKLGLVTELSAEEKKRYSAEQEKKEARERQLKAAAAKKAKEPVRDAKDICERPFGKLNQCVWECVNNPRKEKKKCRLENPQVQCVRRRCNANGEWAEATPLTGEKAQTLCGAQPVVRECDY